MSSLNTTCTQLNSFDTLYFRLREYIDPSYPYIYIDVDFPQVIEDKIKLIEQTCPDMHKSICKLKYGIVSYLNSSYILIPADFTDINYMNELLTQIPGFYFEKPICTIAECVFMYLDPKSSEAVLNWLTTFSTNAFFYLLIFENSIADDTFGMYVLIFFFFYKYTYKYIYTLTENL